MNYQQIGKIIKTFGNKGEFIIASSGNYNLNLLQNGQWLFIDINGDSVPFQIENIHQHSEDTYLVKLKDISFEKANRYTGLYIFTESKKTKNSINDTKYLQGFKVIDKHKGEIGTVKSIIEKDIQDLLEIQYNDKEILIPVDKSIIKKIDIQNKTIYIDAPEGLIDMYL